MSIVIEEFDIEIVLFNDVTKRTLQDVASDPKATDMIGQVIVMKVEL